MNVFETVLLIYFCVGAIVGIPLARRYWKLFRSSNNKMNVVLPKLGKIDFNRVIDSFVFLLAWIVLVVLYPLYIFEILIGKGDKI